jgi:hypothetical protein
MAQDMVTTVVTVLGIMTDTLQPITAGMLPRTTDMAIAGSIVRHTPTTAVGRVIMADGTADGITVIGESEQPRRGYLHPPRSPVTGNRRDF